MKTPSCQKHIQQSISIALAVCFVLCLGQAALGAYFSTRTLMLTISPDLSTVPTPSPSPTPSPTPTVAPGTGLVFSNHCTFVKADWNPLYNGNITEVSMSVDNEKHNLDFNLVFTVPEGHTQQELINNRYWFSGIYLQLSGTNLYDGSISLAGSGNNSSGHGVSQLQNVNLASGASSDNIMIYFYGYNWQVPTYNENGNTITMKTCKSYTNVGVNISRQPWYYTEKYTQTATITLILPNQNTTPSPTPSITPDPTPTLSPSPAITPAPTSTSTLTPSISPAITSDPTLAPTPTAESTITDAAIPTPTAAPEITPADVKEETVASQLLIDQPSTDSTGVQDSPSGTNTPTDVPVE